MLKRQLRKILLAGSAGLIALAGLGPGSGSRALPPSPAPARPKLIVLLVIDQLRYDYLVRFRPYFTEGGFNLLLGGANFTDCRYEYNLTATGPGHATLATGAYPSIHGIIGNDWYDRSLRRKVNCVEDPESSLVGEPGETGSRLAGSPKNLIGTTLGDELRLASDFKSKVVGISLKDRGAILPSGHTANAAFWYDSQTARFITSSYYMLRLPDWVEEFNASRPVKAYCGKPWRALDVTPGAAGKILDDFQPAQGEPCPDARFLEWVDHTPYMNQIELKFAGEAVRNFELGRGPETDLLTVSLSANDYFGHEWGPYSPQVADGTLLTDRYLADFFKSLDSLVGLNSVWIALSADHGVAPTPAFVSGHRLGQGRVQLSAVADAANRALTAAYGPAQWVEGSGEFDLYLNLTALRQHKVREETAENVAADAVASLPFVHTVFTRHQLLSGALPDIRLARSALRLFNVKRSGNVQFVLEPFAVPADTETSTTHGTPWSYDAQIPLILWGSAFKPGIYASPCQTIDLAPTLAAALGITQPSDAQGTPLTEALR